MPTMVAIRLITLQSSRMSANASPAAGGCSVSVITIPNIANPTDNAPNITYDDSSKMDIDSINGKIDKE